MSIKNLGLPNTALFTVHRCNVAHPHFGITFGFVVGLGVCRVRGAPQNKIFLGRCVLAAIPLLAPVLRCCRPCVMFRRRGRVHWVSSRLLTLEQQPQKNILLIPLPHLKALISQILMHIPLGSAESLDGMLQCGLLPDKICMRHCDCKKSLQPLVELCLPCRCAAVL